jgi:hypothetical protein
MRDATPVLCLLFAFLIIMVAAARAAEPETVRGYFCASEADQLSYLQHRAIGETTVMAANAVNKRAGKQSCAPYLPTPAIKKSDKTVIRDGIAYQMQSYVFLPEKVERWTGTFLGALRGLPEADI